MRIPTVLPGRKRYGFISAAVVSVIYVTYLLGGYHGLGASMVTDITDVEIPNPTATVKIGVPSELTDLPSIPPPPRPSGEGKENATMVMLCRNSDIDGALSSIGFVENRFNHRFGYPWVFLNEEEFTDEFKNRISAAISAPVSFGLIPKEHWYQPHWIDETLAAAGRKKMAAANIIYADSVPYRNMCRFNSGFFFRHPLLQPYRYYWRVEPDVKILCDVTYDPFEFMKDNNKIYGFTISFLEWEKTIPTLWSTVKEFIKRYPQYISESNAMDFLSDNNGKSYNLCHFWSNFEIADMDFWRGEAYQKFFDYLESKGGFYYERWGDAPVHSIAAALFSPKEKLHFFRDIGYRHEPFQHCPTGDDREKMNCDCTVGENIDYRPQSCIRRFEKLFD
ncbi:related to Alpha-1,2 mannosyltransferase KTR1 [Armillaria ostoyae]|uniref:Related to Alpha-1,2 mannosyltransferase KTR1 n=1 Tax=Armillaria ostoyae TaxID=47428 RepID=A0A284RBB6_ARMOS|nr:related to Alpha-1,2 mannosyltransferase KTR1 [Armillaria ostoyae]